MPAKGRCAGPTQKHKRARTDERGKNGRDSNATVAKRVGVFDSGLDPPLRFLAPLSINRKKPFGLAQNLRWPHRGRMELVVWKITATCAKIGPGVAQDIDEL